MSIILHCSAAAKRPERVYTIGFWYSNTPSKSGPFNVKQIHSK